MKEENSNNNRLVKRIRELESRIQELETHEQSEVNFRTIADNSFDWEIWVNENEDILYVSPSVERITGFKPEDFYEDKNLLEKIIFPDDRNAYRKDLHPLSKDGEKLPIEYRVVAKSGNVKWLSHLCQDIYNTNGEYLGKRISNREITLQKELEKKYKDSEERFRSIFEQDSSVKLIINPQTGQIEDANPSALKFYGYTKNQLLNKKIQDINQLSEEEVKAEMADAKKRQKTFFNFEHRLSNGEIRHVVVYSSPIRFNNEEKLLSIIHDVTAQKIAEEALKDSEKALFTIVENIPFAVFAHDLNGKLVLVNSAATNYTGYSKSELLNRHVPDIDHESKTRNDAEKIWKELSLGSFEKLESVHFRKDGSSYPVEIHIAAIQLKGEPIILAIAQDITERLAAEKELKNTLGDLKMAQEIAGIGNWQYNPGSEKTTWSDQVYKIYNRNPEFGPFTIKEYEDVFDEEQYAEFFHRFNNAWQHGEPYELILKLKVNNKEVKYLRSTCKPMYKVGKKGYFLRGTTQDITERYLAQEKIRESEEKLRKTFDSEHIAIAISRKSTGEYIDVNKGFCKITGYSAHELIGSSSSDLGFFAGKNRNKLLEKLSGEGFLLNEELSFPTKQGEIRTTLFSIGEVVLKQEECLIATMIDITKRKTAEKALRESEKRLREMNATKDKLFSIISHDLKNPLSNIIGFSELIEHNYDNYSDEKLKKFNSLIHGCSKSIADLLENLLNWSRSQRDIINCIPVKINLNNLVEQCFNLLLASAKNKDIQLINNVKADIFVFADIEMITTVLRNLISNAIKYSYPNSAIFVTVDQNDDEIVIGVVDSGMGMDRTKLAELFNPAGTQSYAGTAGEQGTGLGLTVCKEFVTRNNGQIWAKSFPEKGTTFYFTLPKYGK